MKLAPSLAFALAVAITGAQTWAATAAEHDAHHPAGAASAPSAKRIPAKSKPAITGMDGQMKSMQEMHDEMTGAKTPEERTALMGEHMKTMQDGMAMMSGMAPGGMSGMPKDMASRQQIMEAQMEIMQSVMQMMMDRLPPAPVKRDFIEPRPFTPRCRAEQVLGLALFDRTRRPGWHSFVFPADRTPRSLLRRAAVPSVAGLSAERARRAGLTL